jgi:hypothetical protein
VFDMLFFEILADRCASARAGASTPCSRALTVRRARTVSCMGMHALLALSGLLAATSVARADQVTVTRVSYTHSAATTTDSHYRVRPIAGSPSNWKSPVNYAAGSVHVLLEVKTKPSSVPTKFQVCFEATPNYACTAQSNAYTATGTYEWDTPFSAMWQPDPKNPVDWSKGTREIALILKDTNNGKPQGDPKYVPTDLRVEITLVSAGATFDPAEAGAPIAPPTSDAGARPVQPLDGGLTARDAGQDLGEAGAALPKLDAGTATRDAGADAGRGRAPTAPSDDDEEAADAGPASRAPQPADVDESEDSSGCQVGASSAAGGVPFGLSLLLLATASTRRRTRSSAARYRPSSDKLA